MTSSKTTFWNSKTDGCVFYIKDRLLFVTKTRDGGKAWGKPIKLLSDVDIFDIYVGKNGRVNA